MAMIPLAVVAALGVRYLLSRFSGRQCLALLGLLLALGLIDLARPQLAVLVDDTPAVYASLAHEQGTLLVLPLNSGTLAGKSASLRAQMVHGRPIIGGYATRQPDYPLVRGAPLMSQLNRLDCDGDTIPPVDATMARSALAYYQIRQIVVHTERLSEGEERCVQIWLEGRLGWQPERIVGPVRLYTAPPFAAQPFVFLDRGWHDIEEVDGRRWRWMTEQGRMYLVNPADHPQSFALRLGLESFTSPRRVHIVLNGQSYGDIVVTPAGIRTYTLLLTLEPGQHHMQLEATTAQDPHAQRPISIAIEAVDVVSLR
ncbi:MAG: hypothetical protein HC837_00550 [Chloroflexaceae bacterium]|nr:hypothetical protein [Chloroflexaceae bacterium]